MYPIVSRETGRFVSLQARATFSGLLRSSHPDGCPSRRELKLTSILKDIVHGDVKCENVLIFEKENGTNEESEIHELQLPPSAYA